MDIIKIHIGRAPTNVSFSFSDETLVYHQRLIEGSEEITNDTHIDCCEHFLAKGYAQLAPGEAND